MSWTIFKISQFFIVESSRQCIIVIIMPYKCDFLSTFIDGDAIFDALFVTCYHLMTFEIIYW